MNSAAAAVAAGGSASSAHSTFVVRFLRSIAVNVVVWNGQPLLPEHWHHVFGNQNAVVYFFSNADAKKPDVGDVFTQIVAKVEEASADPFICSSLVTRGGEEETAEDGTTRSPLRSPRIGKQRGGGANNGVSPTGDDGNSPTAMAEPPSSDDDGEQAEQPSDRLRAISHAAGVRFLPMDSDEDEHALQCLIAAQFCPAEISRPLCSLLYQLVESCSATEGHLLDSVSLLPIQTTVDQEISLAAPTNRLCWALHDALGRFAASGRRVAACSCVLSVGSRSIYLGWASEPLMYVVLVVDDQQGQCVGPALVQKNMEFFSMHFYNVVSNTTTKRQYTPMM